MTRLVLQIIAQHWMEREGGDLSSKSYELILIAKMFILQGEAEVLDSSSSDEVSTTTIFSSSRSDYSHLTLHISRMLIWMWT